MVCLNYQILNLQERYYLPLFFLGENLKINKLETFSNQYLSFVKATADTGDFGWGQMSTYHADITSQIFHRQVAPKSIGLILEEKPNFADHLQLIIEKEHKISRVIFIEGHSWVRYSFMGSLWKVVR